MRDQKGFSLIEILLAMALIGILGAAIPNTLSGANRATISTNQHTLAESLARSQVDYIQSQPYDSTHAVPVYAVIPDLPPNYSIVTPMAVRLDPRGDGTATDDGLQKLTVTVKYGSKAVFTLVDYKVNLNP